MNDPNSPPDNEWSPVIEQLLVGAEQMHEAEYEDGEVVVHVMWGLDGLLGGRRQHELLPSP